MFPEHHVQADPTSGQFGARLTRFSPLSTEEHSHIKRRVAL
jgi:hypothetical protein